MCQPKSLLSTKFIDIFTVDILVRSSDVHEESSIGYGKVALPVDADHINWASFVMKPVRRFPENYLNFD